MKKILAACFYAVGMLLCGILLLPQPPRALAVQVDQPGLELAPSGSIFAALNIAPGDSLEAVVSVANNGKGDIGAVTFSARGASGQSALAPWLWLELSDEAGILYSGPLAGAENVALGPMAAGEQRKYSLRVLYSANADNSSQGATATVDLAFVGRPSYPSLPVTGANLNWVVLPGVLLLVLGTRLLLRN